MPTNLPDAYTAATREEVKQDARTGQTFKRWKHRAEGAAIGVPLGAAALIAAKRAIPKRFSFSQQMGLEEGETVNNDSCCVLPTSYEQTEQIRDEVWWANEFESKNYDCDNGIKTGVEEHPGAYQMSIEQLKKKGLNVGQDGPQSPIGEQASIVRLKAPMRMLGRNVREHVMLAAKSKTTNFAQDANMRAHSPSGQFANADVQQSALVRKAYSPHQRNTGVSPFRKRILQQLLEATYARQQSV